MTTAAQGMQFLNFLRGQQRANSNAARADARLEWDLQKDVRDEKFARDKFQFDAERSAAQTNVTRLHKLIGDSAGPMRDHNEKLLHSWFNSLPKIHKDAVAPQIYAGVAGPKQKALYAFDQANPPEPMPGSKESIKKNEETGEFEVQTEPAGIFALGEWTLNKIRTKRRRESISTGQPVDSSPIRVPFGGGMILSELSPGGGPSFISEKDLEFNDKVKRLGGNPQQARLDGYVVTEPHTEWINGQSVDVSTKFDLINDGVSQIKTPSRAGEVLGGSSSVDFAKYLTPNKRNLIAGMQSKFAIGMRNPGDLRDEQGRKDITPEANAIREIKRALDSGDSLDKVGSDFSKKHAGLNFVIVDPKKSEDYNMFNPLEFSDPFVEEPHDTPQGLNHGFFKGAWYNPGHKIGLRVFPGKDEVFNVNTKKGGDAQVTYIVFEPESGISQVYSKKKGILLGTRLEVQRLLDQGILDLSPADFTGDGTLSAKEEASYDDLGLEGYDERGRKKSGG